jgi:hypothetical protein
MVRHGAGRGRLVKKSLLLPDKDVSWVASPTENALPTPTLGKGRQVVHHSHASPPEVPHDRDSSYLRSLLRTAPRAASPRQQLLCTTRPPHLQRLMHSPTLRCGPTSKRWAKGSGTISPGTRALRPASTPAQPAKRASACSSPSLQQVKIKIGRFQGPQEGGRSPFAPKKICWVPAPCTHRFGKNQSHGCYCRTVLNSQRECGFVSLWERDSLRILLGTAILLPVFGGKPCHRQP